MAVKVCEHVLLEELLMAVQGELLRAHRTHLPVALHVLLKATLLKVGRENHLAQRTALVNLTTGVETEAAPVSGKSAAGLMIAGRLLPITDVAWLLGGVFQSVRGAHAS